MLTEDRKATVDALSEGDLAYEVNRGRASRFQGDLYAYAQTRLTHLRQSKQEKQSDESMAIARKTGKETRCAWIVAAAIGIIGIVVQCSGWRS